MKIEYYTSDGVAMPRLKRLLIKEWIRQIAQGRGYTVGALIYQFCDDEEILDYNRRFLGHDYYTDIITFDETTDREISGSMLISLDTVRSNANKYNCTYREELMRVLIHGVLHLTGQKDETDEEEKEMRKLENEALRLWHSLNSLKP